VNYPEESIQHSKHGESLKSRVLKVLHGYTAFNLDVYVSLETDCLRSSEEFVSTDQTARYRAPNFQRHVNLTSDTRIFVGDLRLSQRC